MRSPFGVRNAVAIMVHGKNARVVDESEFHQDVQSPKGLSHDGIARRAISEHCGPGDVLQQVLRAERLLVELFRRLFIDQAMRKAVAGDFMAACGNVSDQLRILLGHPAQHEESPSDIELLEDG